MAERKFTRGLCKPGSAAQVRETVSQAVRESTVLAKPRLVEPLDFETFTLKNRTILQNDSLREMLLFPQDDFSEEVISRNYRTVVPTIPDCAENEITSLFARRCIKSYTEDWHAIDYKYKSYSGSYLQLPRLPKQNELEDQIYEVDTDNESNKDMSRLLDNENGVIKEGFVLKGPESGSDSFISLATKSFKRRYVSLRQEVDGTHILEFHKDDRKSDSKGALCMDFCTKVVRNSKRGKLGFELLMAEGHKSCILAAENEKELDSWLSTLSSVISSGKNFLESGKKPSSPENNEIFLVTPPVSPMGYGTLKGLEHSKNPELARYARETDYTIAQARKENRQNLFAIYPDIQRVAGSSRIYDLEKDVKPYKEEFGIRLLVKCEEVSFRLQAPLEIEKGSLCQVEPYITFLSIYDAKRNRKVSEEFRFDINHPYLRNMLPKKGRKSISNVLTNGNSNGSNLGNQITNSQLQNIGEEWLAYPKQAIFNVQHPESELYFVLKIEKVLQGGITQASDPYLRPSSGVGNGRLGFKVQKMIRSCCQRLGHYRMPFAWAARPIFKPFSAELDTTSIFGPIFRQESSKLSDEDILRFLSDFRKPEKLKHLTVIPGQVKLSLQVLTELPPNSLTSSLMPLVPFPVPPKCEPTIEVEQFPSGVPSNCHPFTVYSNHLYVFPKSLKYDGQKTFTKARNISCTVEIRDGDDETAKPLKLLYGHPGEPTYVTETSTSVTHHNLNPDFYEEVKILLPCHLHDKHHLLFTFQHISCEPPKNTKRRDGPVSSIIGFSWLPLLQKGRLSFEDVTLPVSSILPPGYLSCKPLGLGKGFSGPEIRWVDGGKELFKVGFIHASTVYTKDQHLHNFFFHCQKLLESKVPGSEFEANNMLKLWGIGWWDLSSCPVIPSLCPRPRPQSVPVILSASSSEETRTSMGSEMGRELSKFVKVHHGMVKTLKALHAVDMSTIIHFLPTILNELFHLLVISTNGDVALNTVRVLIHIVHSVHEAGKNDILHSYVQYVFTAKKLSIKKRVVHEELTKSLNATLDPSSRNTDFLVVNKFLRHSWFFFQIIAKSMAQHLLVTERIKMLRQERFPADHQFHIQNLVESVIPHIIQKCKELSIETRQANLSLAYFLKKCLSYMDRGFIFKLVNCYLEKFTLCDLKLLHEYKFEFLEIICYHEHFIALNLPLMRGIMSRGNTKNIKETGDDTHDFEHEYRLSEEFCRHHFLLGTLLQEIRVALSEVHEIRQTAISVFRNLLAKHAFDDRYQGKSHQARIASLYLPFISILMENFSQLRLCTPSGTPPMMHKVKKAASSISTTIVDNSARPITPAVTRRNTIEPTGSLPASARNRDSNYLSIIAGHSQQTVTFANGSCQSIDSNASTPSTVSDRSKECEPLIKEKDEVDSLDGFKCHSRSQSLPFSNSSSVFHFEKLDPTEMKDLLVCFLYIIKHVNEELLIGWWQHCSENDVLDFFQILELCLHQFKYMGKKNIKNQHPAMFQPKSMTLPARTPPPAFTQRCNSTYSDTTHAVSPSSSEADTFYRALLEANMATEVGLIALDILGLYSLHLKDQLLHKDGDNLLMKKLFDIYLSFLQVGQSEKLFKHLFAALRAFISKFPIALFQGNAVLCGKLCFELLRCCNSKLQTVRNEACAILYLLMRGNFEFSSRKELTRVHLQLIVSVSRLLGDVTGLNNARLQESLSVINNYANSDKAMQNTVFPSEVKDLTKRIRTVLMATMQMKEHENDPEMLVDLQHQLASSYASTPALRKTWLESMARIHLKNTDFSEAAHCFIHIAAVEAEYLKQKCMFPDGCSAFKTISPNVQQDESNQKDDSGIHDIQYSENTLLERLEQCVKMLEQAERYEVLAEAYKLIIPIYERQRNFEALMHCYKTLHNAFAKIVEVNRTGKRLLGKYYRVAFFGQPYFDEEAGKEYIYKEPKVTSLAEISERLYQLYCDKYGRDAVKMIMDSNQVNAKDLEIKYAYVQVTHVVPYFDEDELRQRPTEFERNNNLRRFMFETPFTVDSNKVRGLPEEQCKRRTVLTTLYSFPYVKKRIPVFSKTVQVLSPIEVAIDEMQSRICELEEVVTLQPTDLKKLQLKLQGSISVQVNAGPLAYAKAFLEGRKPDKYPPEMITALKDVYRRFISVCQEALDLNGRIITSDQYEYHTSLKKNFQEFVDSLSGMLHEKLHHQDKDSLSLKRTSLEVFNYISGSPGSSTV